MMLGSSRLAFIYLLLTSGLPAIIPQQPSLLSQRHSHPLCQASFTTDNVPPLAKSVTDITPVFHGVGLPDGACIFNPAVVHVTGNIYCLFARVYNAQDPLRRCRQGHLERPPFMDGWRGQSTNVLAVLRLRALSNSSKVEPKLMGYSYLEQSNHEDGRLFKDAHGRVFVYLGLPMGVPPKRAVINTVSRVLIRCHRGRRRCRVSLGYPRLLSYFGSSSVMDKNWVPWNGTAFMSYSHYGSIGPHSIFNWGSYDEPEFHTAFDAVAEDAVFTEFVRRYGKLLYLSGGSPAVLEPGGASFLAVGHLKAHPGCFHLEVAPAWAKGAVAGLPEGVQSRCTHLAAAAGTEAQRQEVLRTAFKFGDPQDLGIHYPWEYAFFFYRFNATPPYNMTHISHGFIPYTGAGAQEHTGIVFPIGLERFRKPRARGRGGDRGPGPHQASQANSAAAGGNGDGDGDGDGEPDYLVTYGDSDQASRILRISARQVNAMLWPLSEIGARLDEYTVCSLPCEGGSPACIDQQDP